MSIADRLLLTIVKMVSDVDPLSLLYETKHNGDECGVLILSAIEPTMRRRSSIELDGHPVCNTGRFRLVGVFRGR